MKSKPEIIFEDDDLIIVNKPAHFLTIPDRFVLEKPNLLTFLKNKYENIFVVHRLDKETSGVICFAKNETAHRNLSQQFEYRTVDKFYLAIVEGQLHKEEGEIDKPIANNMRDSGRMVIAKRGKASLTVFKLLEKFKNYSLVEANIKTGRTHQVRIHFESIGYPLMIDSVYGRQSEFFLSKIKLKKYRRGKDVVERPLMSRTTLHAHKVAFDHPTSGERVHFEVEPPKDFRAVLNQLRKWGS